MPRLTLVQLLLPCTFVHLLSACTSPAASPSENADDDEESSTEDSGGDGDVSNDEPPSDDSSSGDRGGGGSESSKDSDSSSQDGPDDDDDDEDEDVGEENDNNGDDPEGSASATEQEDNGDDEVGDEESESETDGDDADDDGDDGNDDVEDEGTGDDGAIGGNCVDPQLDCLRPENVCFETYCDEDAKCAERAKEDGTVVQDWEAVGSCEFDEPCLIAGTQVWQYSQCQDGTALVDREERECQRENTDGIVVEDWSDWDDCEAVSPSDGVCSEEKVRRRKVCWDEILQEEQDFESCSVEGDEGCGNCGNGIVEALWGEECDGDPSCASDCLEKADDPIFVSLTAVGNEDGSSWDDAFTDLSSAIDLAKQRIAEGSEQIAEIWVAKGTYRPIGGREDSFHVDRGIRIFGGFAGHESRRTERELDPTKTILSGGADGEGASRSRHVVRISGSDRNSRLDNFTIRGGYAAEDREENNPLGWGGGIVCVHDRNQPGGEAFLRRLRLEENFAQRGGGGYFRACSPTFIETVTINNNGTLKGGGLYFWRSGPTVFVGENQIQENRSEVGGGIFSFDGNIEIHGSVSLEENEAVYDGGGVAVLSVYTGSTTTVRVGGRVDAKNNSAGFGGGGFYFWEDQRHDRPNADQRFYVQDHARVELSDNEAGFGGGFFNSRDALFVVEEGGKVRGADNIANDQNGGGGFHNEGLLEGDVDVKGNRENVGG